MTRPVLIALGANIPLHNSCLIENLRHGASLIQTCGNLRITKMSGVYSTAPADTTGRQPRYVNAVIEASCPMPPGQLLRCLKRIEREAGRRQRGLNAPRPLDLDILDYRGQCLGSRRPRTRGQAKRQSRPILVLPHPELHRRRFVLEPLLEIRPHWVHPALGRSARQLVSRLPRPPGSITRLPSPTGDPDWWRRDDFSGSR